MVKTEKLLNIDIRVVENGYTILAYPWQDIWVAEDVKELKNVIDLIIKRSKL